MILNPNLQYFFASERDWMYSRPLPMFASDDWVRGLLGNHAPCGSRVALKVPFCQLYHLHAEGEKEIFSPVVISEMRRQIDETNFTLCSNTGLFSVVQAPP